MVANQGIHGFTVEQGSTFSWVLSVVPGRAERAHEDTASEQARLDDAPVAR